MSDLKDRVIDSAIDSLKNIDNSAYMVCISILDKETTTIHHCSYLGADFEDDDVATSLHEHARGLGKQIFDRTYKSEVIEGEVNLSNKEGEIDSGDKTPTKE